MDEVRRSEGVYRSPPGHFSIECACGSSKPCRYEKFIPEDEDVFDETDHVINRQIDSDGSFYIRKDVGLIYYTNVVIFESMLVAASCEDRLPIVLICQDCHNKFRITPELYTEVVGKILKL